MKIPLIAVLWLILSTTLLRASEPPEEILKLLHDHTPLPPTKVFDDLYCIGTKSVVAWALTTEQGIILIDSMWNNDDARVVEKGLRKHGLNPKDIKYIIITHGHGDHYGGADFLRKKYAAKVVMTKVDEQFMHSLTTGPNAPEYPKPAVDLYVKTGDKISLGGKDILIVETPGHTPGGLSVLFPVLYKGKEYQAMLWGGTGIPDDRSLQKSYKDSLIKFEKYAKSRKVSVELTAHLFHDNGYARLESVNKGSYGDQHPFIVGEKKIDEFFTTYKKMVDDKLSAKK